MEVKGLGAPALRRRDRVAESRESGSAMKVGGGGGVTALPELLLKVGAKLSRSCLESPGAATKGTKGAGLKITARVGSQRNGRSDRGGGRQKETSGTVDTGQTKGLKKYIRERRFPRCGSGEASGSATAGNPRRQGVRDGSDDVGLSGSATAAL
ncbi:hypothetical protein NDU88_001380 [Pleurodeles waltl]|uniref:Uncharacterized protein n=1 Tax=Pleurodeles waltl TaxID=8319 RepID=A0AAV7T063_PLEWA|nr:hypothetical protein NDU88_001380 [Pleurodeles waltl]